VGIFERKSVVLEINASSLPSRPKTALTALKKNVLTAKLGRFLGVLEEKQGLRHFKKSFYFVFFRFFGDYLSCKPLIIKNSYRFGPSQKNHA
jgi:hypothetical protein